MCRSTTSDQPPKWWFFHVSPLIGGFRMCHFFSPSVNKIYNQPIAAAASKRLASAWKFESLFSDIHPHTHTPNYLLPVTVSNLSIFCLPHSSAHEMFRWCCCSL